MRQISTRVGRAEKNKRPRHFKKRITVRATQKINDVKTIDDRIPACHRTPILVAPLTKLKWFRRRIGSDGVRSRFKSPALSAVRQTAYMRTIRRRSSTPKFRGMRQSASRLMPFFLDLECAGVFR